jgi:hypothetical protein
MTNLANERFKEIMSADHLSAFTVFEKYCDWCGGVTPHHIDDFDGSFPKDQVHKTPVPPASLHECVVCREQEEALLDQRS